MHGGDQRWSFPSREAIAASRPQDLQTLLLDPLARGQIEVIVVGDITADQAIAATAATFGALHRPQPPAPAVEQRQISFPAPATQPIVEHHKGRADLAVAVAAWPTTDFFADPQEARTLRVMVEVMRLRLIDDLRIAQGATYSPGVSLDSSFVFPGYGYVSASVQIPPAKIGGFFADVDKIAGDLKTHDASSDELTRATLPRIEALQKARQTNEFWLDALANGQTDPRSLDAIRTQIPQMQRVTAADVRKVANKYLLANRAWNFEVLPEAQTP
jgi:zinc protease